MVALAMYLDHNDEDQTHQKVVMCHIPCIDGFEDAKQKSIEIGNAYDIILIESVTGELFSQADFSVSFPNSSQPSSLFSPNRPSRKLVLEIGEPDENTNNVVDDDWDQQSLLEGNDAEKDEESGSSQKQYQQQSSLDLLSASSPWKPERSFEIDTQRLEEDPQFRYQFLKSLQRVLRRGANPARYLLFEQEDEDRSKTFLRNQVEESDDNSERSSHPAVIGVAFVNLFVWSSKDKVLISDIDGTITKSNTTGIFDTILTEQYAHCHEGICQLYAAIVGQVNNKDSSGNDEETSTRVVYLTSRPVALASCTRRFLENLRQGGGHCLPQGPILGFHGNFTQLLWMELVSHRTQEFKADRLWKNLVQPFQEAGAPHHQDFLLGAFGNTLMDIQAYHMVGVGLQHSYLIEKSSKIHAFDKDDNSKRPADLTLNSPRRLGPERPKAYFRSKMHSHFQGYADKDLLDHLMV